ncbi:hypothetical protein GTW40_31510, partial [Streptomyces sp. SID4985]|nr:hypothetical protein [Streptomyces sp. SID4985]
TRGVCGALGWVARVLLRACREHAVLMERGVAAAAAERAQSVDYGPRIVAQEQVGLAYAGWDRLLTRVALPAWRMGRWPSRLDAGVVAALTELSRRDRLAADGFTSRLGERPACDLLEEPGVADEAVSLLAARLFHGAPTGPGPQWSPVDWHAYPEEVVDRTWRAEAARLHRVLDGLPDRPPASGGATLARVLDHLATPAEVPGTRVPEDDAPAVPPSTHTEPDDPDPTTERGSALAAGLSAELAREESTVPRGATASGLGRDPELWDEGALPLFPLQPPRTGRELLVAHVTAMVCCAAVDSAGAAPGLDWLDGPTLLLDGKRAADLGPRVLSLIEEGDQGPLRDWLAAAGIRPEKPVRLG